MTYRGTVQNGVVVLEPGKPPLPEGTVVTVEPQPAVGEPARGTVAALLRFRDECAGPPDPDWIAQAEIVQADREADLALPDEPPPLDEPDDGR